MSQSTAFDVKADLIARLEKIGETYVSDLSFIPEDKLGVSPMGAARTPLEFTAECIGFNFLLADALAGKPAEIPDEDARKAFFASIDSGDKAKKGLATSVAKLAKAIEALSLEELSEPATAPWGEEMTKLRLCGMSVTHMIYHAGQLNYIQTMYGDCENHWHA